jgi:hypothetical protein
MAEHGGYRKPANPAPVSGPGAHSKRTDGSPGSKQAISVMPGQDYGQAGQDQAAQQAVRMGGATPLPSPAQAGPGGQQGQAPQSPQYEGGDFGAPSSRPDEPVTAGAPVGPGPGPEALNTAPGVPSAAAGTGAMTALLQRLSPTDTTGILGQLLIAAQARGA